MDYTGERGKIHLPEKTALALKDLNVDLSCRGTIDVKGKGKMVTYWVNLNDKMEVNIQSAIPEESFEEQTDSEEILNHQDKHQEESDNESLEKMERIQSGDSDSRNQKNEESQDQIEHSLNYIHHMEGTHKGATGILKHNRFTRKRSSEVSTENLKNSHGVRWEEETETVKITENGDSSKAETMDTATQENNVQDAHKLQIIAQVNMSEDTEPEEFTAEELARLESKKDSGYGSQGILKVNKATKTLENGDSELIKQNRTVPEKLNSRQDILKHYDSYQDFNIHNCEHEKL